LLKDKRQKQKDARYKVLRTNTENFSKAEKLIKKLKEMIVLKDECIDIKIEPVSAFNLSQKLNYFITLDDNGVNDQSFAIAQELCLDGNVKLTRERPEEIVDLKITQDLDHYIYKLQVREEEKM
jgi:hypothetical protein